LFGLYIDDFESTVLAAAQRGEQLDLPCFPGSDSPVPPLLYADDMTLLATSAAGLQAQLDLLPQYCHQWGLTVNTAKTKPIRLSGGGGRDTEPAALQAVQQAGLTFGGQPMEGVTHFKYLGIVFHASKCQAGSAAPARAAAARGALHKMQAKCAALGVEAAQLRLQLFTMMVDSVLSYGSAVWGTQLAAAAASNPAGSTGCAAEKLHIRYLRRQLGVRQGTPTAVVLAETAERPLWLRWLLRSVRLWNKALAAQPESLLRQAANASILLALAPGSRTASRQSWAQQLAAGLAAVGVHLDLGNPRPLSKAAVLQSGRERQLAQLLSAATRDGATKLQHYTVSVCGGKVDAASLGIRAPYLDAVRERSRREALAQLVTGSHWGAEETGRWQKLPREQRVCPHCHQGIEDVDHMVFHCPLYALLRLRFASLFQPTPASLHEFLQQSPACLASFAAACKRLWLDSTQSLLASSAPTAPEAPITPLRLIPPL